MKKTSPLNCLELIGDKLNVFRVVCSSQQVSEQFALSTGVIFYVNTFLRIRHGSREKEEFVLKPENVQLEDENCLG